MKEQALYPATFPPLGRRAGLNVAPPRSATANGTEVEIRVAALAFGEVYKRLEEHSQPLDKERREWT